MFDSKLGINRFEFDFQLNRFLSSSTQNYFFQEKKGFIKEKELTVRGKHSNTFFSSNLCIVGDKLECLDRDFY